MPTLTLKFKKKSDAGTVFTAVRDDGSATSSDLGPSRGFGPMHDFCHFVVEGWFGFREGFLGLLAIGWTIQDFEIPGTAATLPFEACQAEWLAGTLSLDLGAGQQFGPDAYYAAYEGVYRKSWPDREPAVLTDHDLDSLRNDVRSLLIQWGRVPVNESMNLVLDLEAGAKREEVMLP